MLRLFKEQQREDRTGTKRISEEWQMGSEKLSAGQFPRVFEAEFYK